MKDLPRELSMESSLEVELKYCAMPLLRIRNEGNVAYRDFDDELR